MKRAILYGTLCLSVHASAQDTTYFAQDFDDWEDRNFRTWSQHNDKMITTDTQALPHVKFNDIRGGEADRAILDTTYASDVIANRSLKVFIPNSARNFKSPHYGRSISYYLGGQVVRGDAAVDTTWKKGQPIRDSFVPDNDEMYLRYHIKLDPSWLFRPAGAKAHVVKIPGLAGTHKSGSGGMWPQDPDSLGWSARMLAGASSEYGPDEWSPISYVYHLDQKCGNLVHSCGTGDHFPSGSDGVEWDLLPRHQMGQWYRIEQRIKMNDPDNEPGQGNGLIEVWIDGEKDPDLCNYELRYTTADTIGINRLWADIHYGGKYESPADNTLYLDNFHVSTGPTPWSGELVGDSGWSGTIHVDGDVIVPDGVTLTIEAGTQVRFAATDAENDGQDRDRAELIVQGTLTATATGIAFRSASDPPSASDWYGIRLESSGTATLTDVTIRDSQHCAPSAASGAVTLTNPTYLNCGAPPPRPTSGLEVERGVGQLTVGWDAVTADPAVTSYTLEYQRVKWGPSMAWPEVWQPLATPAPAAGGAAMYYAHEVDVPGADPEGWTYFYRYRVRAHNDRGAGPFSEAFPEDGVSPLPPRMPAMVVLNMAADLLNDGLRITTGCPPSVVCGASSGDAQFLLEYRVQHGAGPLGEWQRGSYEFVEGVAELSGGSGVTVTLTPGNLESTMSHKFEARLVTGGESGEASEAFWLVPLQAESGSTAGEVELSWSPPSEAASLTGLTYEYRTGPPESWGSWQAIAGSGPSTTSHTVSGLSAGSHRFQVRAVQGTSSGGARGASTRTTPSRVVSPRVTSFPATAEVAGDVPPQPTAELTARPGGGTGINVGWGAVSATPAVTRYRVRSQWALVGTSSWSSYDTVATPGASTLRYTHRDYTNVVVKHRLRYQVQAVNDSGAGAWSAAFPPRGLVPPPSGQPRLESMGVDARAVTMTWECPNYRWCEPLTGSTVAPMTLEAQGKSGGGAWGDDWEAVTTGQLTSIRHLVADLAAGSVHQFRTRAVNSEGAEGLASSSVAVFPLRAQGGAGQVALSWDSPGGSRLSWQYRSKAGAAAWASWQSVPDSEASTTTYTVPDLTNGVDYQFQIQALSGRRVRGVSFLASATPARPPVTLTISGPSSVSYAEHRTDTVATYRVTDAQGAAVSPVSWSVEGVDADTLRIDASGGLGFETSPDFEAPGDRARPASATVAAVAGGDNVYMVKLKAKDTSTPPDSTTWDVTVTVTNEDEPGVVRLSTRQPKLGTQLTATLESDPDGGVSNIRSGWHALDGSTVRSRRPRGPRGPRGLAETDVYTVEQSDVGKRLVASFLYDDAHGPNKMARDTTEVVAGGTVVSFAASTYEAAEGGASATVTVTMSPPAAGPVSIPLEFEAGDGTEADDFSHDLGTDETLSFASEVSSRSFTVTAAEDVDGADGTVTVRFGALPSGVEAGTPAETVVSLVDDDEDRPGVVRLRPATTPQVGTALRATLADPDGAVTDTMWQWQRRRDAQATTPWSDLADGTLSVYVPKPADVDSLLRATVSYDDAHGPGKGAESEAIGPVTAVPSRTVSYSASSYVATEDGDTATVRVVMSPAPEEDQTFDVQVTVQPGPGTETADFAAVDLPSDSTLSFTAAAASDSFQIVARSDADSDDETVLLGFKALPAGLGTGAHATATVNLLDATLKVVGPASVEVEERGGVSVATYRATDPWDGPVSPVTWTRTGPDSSRFEINGNTLAFKSEPDYEHPLDVGGDNIYDVNLQAAYGGVYHSAPFPVAVTVTNGPDPGRVTLSTRQPKVGQHLTATLESDPDGGVTNITSGWHALDGSTLTPRRPRGPRGLGETYRYTVQERDLGQRLVATFYYDDAAGSGQTARDTSDAVQANVPGRPGKLEATAGIEQVALTWTAADSNGAWITSYQYQRSTDNGNTWWPPDWREIPGSGAATTTYAETELSSDTTYTFEVRAVNAVGEGPASNQDSAQPVTPGACELSLGGSTSVDYAENGTDAVGTYTVTRSSACDATLRLTWSRAGDDSSAFQLQGAGASRSLHFNASPNYEHALDEGGDNVYDVELQVTDGSATASRPVTVTVTDANDPGMITISPASPRVGETLRATLTDEDDVLSAAPFNWRALEPGARAHETQQSETATHVASQSAVGKHIEASTTYTDRHGGQRAKGRTAGVVRPNKPGAPGNLEATAGDEQVTLRWTAADSNGAWITGYQYRWRLTMPPDWSSGASAGTGLSHTVEDLTNGRTHTFEVRARNRVGEGPASNQASATPRAPPCELSLSGPASVDYVENGTGSVGTYTATAINCPSLTWSRTGTNPSDFQLQGSGSSRSLHFNTPPNYEVKSSYEVTVEVSAGSESATRTVTVTVTNEPERGTVTMSPSRPYVDDQVTATLTDPDGGITGATWSWGAEAPGARSAPPPTSTQSYRYTVPSSAFGKILRASVSYSDVHGSGQSADTTSTGTVRRRPCELSLSGPASVDYVENGTGSVGTYTATATNCPSLTWSRVGTNPSDFQLQGSGSSRSLHFNTPPNYEVKSSYEVTVEVSAGSESATRTVTVNVEDVDEPGTVTLSSSRPYVGDRVWATLTDPDGVEGPTWSWTSVGTGSRSVPSTDSYYHTVPASAFGRMLQATVGYTDAHGSQRAVGTAGPVQKRPCSLSLSGSTSVDYAENGTGSVGTYTATATHCDGLTWSLAGDDDTDFELSGSGTSRTLEFDDPPNYEVKSSYEVTVEVGAGSESATRTVTVTVTNVDEPGTVTLSDSSPHVGDQLTATLTDPDQGIRQPTWSWTSGGTAARSSSVQSLRYTVPVGDFGKILKASVGYTDNHGPGKSASRTSSALVGAHRPDPPPDFDAARGDGTGGPDLGPGRRQRGADHWVWIPISLGHRLLAVPLYVDLRADRNDQPDQRHPLSLPGPGPQHRRRQLVVRGLGHARRHPRRPAEPGHGPAGRQRLHGADLGGGLGQRLGHPALLLPLQEDRGRRLARLVSPHRRGRRAQQELEQLRRRLFVRFPRAGPQRCRLRHHRPDLGVGPGSRRQPRGPG